MGNWQLMMVFLLLACSAQAEIFTWVDENGKKHFGDRVPPEYWQENEPVAVDVHHPSEESVARAKVIASQTKAITSRERKNTIDVEPTVELKQPLVSPDQYASLSCEKRKQIYRDSEACYAKCAENHVLRSPGSLKVTRRVRNTSNCGHCQDLKKPKC